MTVAALRRLLDEIDNQGGPRAARRGRLQQLDDPAAAPPAAEVRAWAHQAGVDCAPAGPLPRRVLAAWYAAHRPGP